MTATIALALSTSLLFGVGDFLGGVATRRDSAFAVTGTSHLISIVFMAVAVLILPAPSPTGTDIIAGALSGLSGVIGVLCLYGALAVGRMSIVAPVSAALSASLPAVYDVATGTSLSPLAICGIVLALVAIVIVSVAPDDRLYESGYEYRPRRALVLAMFSGVGFAGGFIALSFTSVESGLTPILAARVVSIAVAVFLAFRVGKGFPVDRTVLAPTFWRGCRRRACQRDHAQCDQARTPRCRFRAWCAFSRCRGDARPHLPQRTAASVAEARHRSRDGRGGPLGHALGLWHVAGPAAPRGFVESRSAVIGYAGA